MNQTDNVRPFDPMAYAEQLAIAVRKLSWTDKLALAAHLGVTKQCVCYWTAKGKVSQQRCLDVSEWLDARAAAGDETA